MAAASLFDWGILANVFHASLMVIQAFTAPNEHAHLWADIPFLYALAAVMWWWHPNRKSAREGSNMSGSYDYDVIVVGTGYGGASAAESLARAGLKVGILERGTWWGGFEGHRSLPETLPQLAAALAMLNLSSFGRGVSIPLLRYGLLEALATQRHHRRELLGRGRQLGGERRVFASSCAPVLRRAAARIDG